MNNPNNLSRRNFLSNTSLGVVGIIGTAGLITSCSENSTKNRTQKLPTLLDRAPDGKVLKAGLIGCGSRGTGAAVNFIDAGPNLQITALGDVFQDKLNSCRIILRNERKIEIADENCFIGFDCYQKVIDSGVDIVLLCTPPHFRPVHLEAAINARKHVFMEKPVAIDPVGARSVLVSSKKADQFGLSIISGTIRRVQKDYLETYSRVSNGEIGEIVSAHIIRNGVAAWVNKRKTGWTDMEYMLRNWTNFCWLSGDHIVEQFVHEIDVMNWFLDKLPVKAIGWGGRQRRRYGDQYDFFSVEYLYENGMQTHCASRQIDGCSNLKRELIIGTKGMADCNGTIFDLQGQPLWKYPYPKEEEIHSSWHINNPYVQEHVNLVTAIRNNQQINDSENQANSTLVCIMGRISAYTGKDVTWDEVIYSDLRLGPKNYIFGSVPNIKENIPVVGIEKVIL